MLGVGQEEWGTGLSGSGCNLEGGLGDPFKLRTQWAWLRDYVDEQEEELETR